MANETITRLLVTSGADGPAVLAELVPLVYDELRLMARRFLADEAKLQTLDTTALVSRVPRPGARGVRFPCVCRSTGTAGVF